MASSKPLEQTLSLNDNFTSTLDKIDRQLNNTIRTFSAFAVAGNQSIHFNPVLNPNFSSSMDEMTSSLKKMEIDSNSMNLSSELKGLAELESTVRDVYTGYQNEIDSVNDKIVKGNVQLDLQAQKLTLLSSKLANQQNKYNEAGSSGDTSKALDLALSMNQTQQAIERTSNAIEKQEAMLNDAQRSFRQLTAEAGKYEALLKQTQNTTYAIANSPIVKMDEIRRGIVDIQTLKDRYQEFKNATNQRLMIDAELQKGVVQAGRLSGMMNMLKAGITNTNMAVRMGTNYLIGQARQLRNNMTFVANENSLRGKASSLILKSEQAMRRVVNVTKQASSATVGWIASLGRGAGKVASVTAGIARATSAQQGLNRVARLLSFDLAIRGIQQLYQTISRVMSVVDENTMTTARLAFLSGDVADNWNKIMASANRARTSFNDTATFITRMAQNAGDAFNSTDEIIAFTEALNKMYVISGASAQEQASSMLQLSQAMGQGVLQGQELRSVLQGAPAVAQAIAKYLNVSVGELKDMGAEGELTASVVKNAMFSAIEDTNAQFATMPITFQQAVTRMANHATTAFKPVMEALNNFVNSEQGTQIMSFIMQVINAVALGTIKLMEITSNVVSWINDNIETVKMGMVGLAVVAGVMAVSWVIANWAIFAVIAGIALFAVGMTNLGFTAQEVFGFIIGALFFIGAVFKDLALIVGGVVGTIGIVMFTLGRIITQIIYAILVTIGWAVDSAIKWVVYFVQKAIHFFTNFETNMKLMWNNVVLFGIDAFNGLGNFFVGFINWALEKFGGFADGVLNIVNPILEAMGKDPITFKVDKLDNLDMFSSESDKLRQQNLELQRTLDATAPEAPDIKAFPKDVWTEVGDIFQEGRDTFDDLWGFVGDNFSNPMDSYQNGVDWVDSLVNGFGDFWKEAQGYGGGTDPLADSYPLDMNNISLGEGDNTIGDIGKINSDVAITDEDLKYLRDIAERKFTMNYNQLTPQATLNYYGAGASSDEDVQRLLGRLETIIDEKNQAYLG